jgi:lipopolysaccharide heptosyltransferase II
MKGAWADARKILCIRLDNLGDVLMTTPALRALKSSNPEGSLTLLASRSGAAVAPMIPEIDECIVYEAPWMKASAPKEGSFDEYGIAQLLREKRFDAAVIFTVYSQNPLPAAFLCYLADIPLRLSHCHENPYQLLTDWVQDPEPGRVLRHEVRRQLDLVSSVGAMTTDETMSLAVPQEARAKMISLLRQIGITFDDRWVAVHPGATAPSRRYPPEKFSEVASRLVDELGCRIVFTGGKEERDLIRFIQSRMGAPSESFAGELELTDMAALLSVAPVLLSNNTGPVHIAAAVGTPVVDLYALTNPQHTPWGVRHKVLFHDVPCKYCYKSVCPQGHQNCLRLVDPEQIVAAVRDLLGAGSPAEEPDGVHAWD